MDRGQATTEYVGAVTLVAVILTIAGAVAAPDLPRALAHHLRVALCIAGGDVCRAADARRAGLEPCVVGAESGHRGDRVTIALVSYGHRKRFAVERRSDGSARVSVAEEDGGGLIAGVGVDLERHVSAGAEAGATIGFTSGAAWELADEAALERFLRGVRRGPRMGLDLAVRGAPAPTEVFRAGTGSVRAEAGLQLLGLDQPVAEAAGHAVLGRRTRAGRTTWFVDAGHVGPRLFGGLIPEVPLGRPGAWVLELGRRPQELRLVTAVPGAGGTTVEIDARLDLGVPANAAVVRDLLARPSRERARAIGRHFLAAGVVERRTYRVRELAGDPDVALKLGFVGYEHDGGGEERTLVAADVLRDGTVARRQDCLGAPPQSRA